jgi:cyclophilin family peptidyl-prolyl cis-trans isomerase
MSAPNSASTQFYVTTGDRDKTEHLNQEYTVFGQVTEGIEIANNITTQAAAGLAVLRARGSPEPRRGRTPSGRRCGSGEPRARGRSVAYPTLRSLARRR